MIIRKAEYQDTVSSIENLHKITYKDTNLLNEFINDQGKILPRRQTGLNSKQQKRVAKLIKRARIAALLPFVIGKT